MHRKELCVTSSIFQMPKRAMQADLSEGACHEVGGRPRPPPIEGRQTTDLPIVYMGRFELFMRPFNIMCKFIKVIGAYTWLLPFSLTDIDSKWLFVNLSLNVLESLPPTSRFCLNLTGFAHCHDIGSTKMNHHSLAVFVLPCICRPRDGLLGEERWDDGRGGEGTPPGRRERDQLDPGHDYDDGDNAVGRFVQAG